MYALEFSGWAQCRLPTDPDPSNEPRGVSGYSFALPGEPDLDRVIRFQPGEGYVHRPATQDVGVRVRSGWYLDPSGESPSKRLPRTSPLIGAAVDLEGDPDPEFYSRNYIVVNAGFGVIWPFVLSIDNQREDGERVRIQRSVVMDEDNPDANPLDLPEAKIEPYALVDAFSQSALVLAETGIVDARVFRAHRLREVEALRRDPDNDDVTNAALDKRIDELKWNDDVNRRTQQIPTLTLCRYTLNGDPVHVHANGTTQELSPAPWKFEMWMGGWDADSLDFYVKGAVILTGIDDHLPRPDHAAGTVVIVEEEVE